MTDIRTQIKTGEGTGIKYYGRRSSSSGWPEVETSDDVCLRRPAEALRAAALALLR